MRAPTRNTVWIRLITFTVITAMVCQNMVWADGYRESKLAKGTIFDDSGDFKAQALDSFLKDSINDVFENGRLSKIPTELEKYLKGFFEVKGEMVVEGDNAVVNIELTGAPARLFFSKSGYHFEYEPILAEFERAEFELVGFNKGVAKNVYKVKQRDTGRIFWAKFADKGDEGEETEKRVIIPQEEILRYLNGRNIQGICKLEHSLRLENGRNVLLFEELPKGKPLSEMLAGLTMDKAIDIMLKILYVINELHKAGVYHWDISPHNIWVTDADDVIIFDFDFAFRTDDKNGFMERGLFGAFTPSYSSQKRYLWSKGNYRKYTEEFPHSSEEIYSLGVLLLNLLADYKVPMIKQEQTPQQYANEQLRKLEESVEIPEWLRQILEKAISNGRCNYKNVDEFIANLNSLAEEAQPVRHDGCIAQGTEAIAEFKTNLGEGRYNERVVGIEREFNDILKDYEVYGFDSIVKGRDDFVLGYRMGNKIYVALDLVGELRERDPTLGLLRDYLRHEVLCETEVPGSHDDAIARQRKEFSDHYNPEKYPAYNEEVIRDKGILKYALREFIDKKYFPVLNELALRIHSNKDDYKEIFYDEVLYDCIHELKIRMADIIKESRVFSIDWFRALELLKRIYEKLASGYMEDRKFHADRVVEELSCLLEFFGVDKREYIQSLITDMNDRCILREVNDIDRNLEFLEVIEFGDFSVVKKVRDKTNGRIYALKFFHQRRNRIDPEYEVMQSLKGIPGVPRVYKLYSGVGILMEYIEGKTLFDAGKQEEEFFKELEWIVWAIFEKGYVIDDFHAKNIMVRDDGTPALIDFCYYERRQSDEESDRAHIEYNLEELRREYLRQTQYAEGYRATVGGEFKDEEDRLRPDAGEKLKQYELVRMFNEPVKRYAGDRGRVVNQGSVGKGTDLPGKFDIDIIVLYEAGTNLQEEIASLVTFVRNDGWGVGDVKYEPCKDGEWLIRIDVNDEDGHFVTHVDITLGHERVIYADMFNEQLRQIEEVNPLTHPSPLGGEGKGEGYGAVNAVLGDIRLLKLLLQRELGAYKDESNRSGWPGMSIEQLIIQSGGTEENGWKIKGVGSFRKAMEWLYRAGFDERTGQIVPLEIAKTKMKLYDWRGLNLLDNRDEENWHKLVYAAKAYVKGKRMGKVFNNLGELKGISSLLMGKYKPVSIIEFIPDKEGSETGFIRFMALDMEKPEGAPVEIEIKARRVHRWIFDPPKETRRKAIDDLLKDYIDRFSGDLLILKPNSYGIRGIGTRDLIAVAEQYMDEDIAKWHEIAHSAIDARVLRLETISGAVFGQQGAIDDYLKRKFRKHIGDTKMENAGRLEDFKRDWSVHYILRLFQKQVWDIEDTALSMRIKAREKVERKGLKSDVKWTKVKGVIGKPGKGKIKILPCDYGNMLVMRRVRYKGRTFMAKYAGNKNGELTEEVEEERFIIPQAEILRNLNIEGVYEVKHFVQLKNGRKLILFEEFPRGETLGERLKREDTISEKEALRIIITVSRIVQELHKRGIYHWDINPDNIYLADNGKVILFDFDLVFKTKEEFLQRRLYAYWTPGFESQKRAEYKTIHYDREEQFVPDEIYSLAMTLLKVLVFTERIGDDEVPSDYAKYYLYRLERLGISKQIRDLLFTALFDGECKYESMDRFIRELEACQSALSQGGTDATGKPVAVIPSLRKVFGPEYQKGKLKGEEYTNEICPVIEEYGLWLGLRILKMLGKISDKTARAVLIKVNEFRFVTRYSFLIGFRTPAVILGMALFFLGLFNMTALFLYVGRLWLFLYLIQTAIFILNHEKFVSKLASYVVSSSIFFAILGSILGGLNGASIWFCLPFIIILSPYIIHRGWNQSIGYIERVTGRDLEDYKAVSGVLRRHGAVKKGQVSKIWRAIKGLNKQIEKAKSFKEREELVKRRNDYTRRLWNRIKGMRKGKYIDWIKLAKDTGIQESELKAAIFNYLVEETDGDYAKMQELSGCSLAKVKELAPGSVRNKKVNFVRALAKIKSREDFTADERRALLEEFLRNITDPTFPGFSFETKTRLWKVDKGQSDMFIPLGVLNGTSIMIKKGLKDKFGGKSRMVRIETVFDPYYGWIFKVSAINKPELAHFYRYTEDEGKKKKKFLDLFDPIQQTYLDSIEPKRSMGRMPRQGLGEFTLDYGPRIIIEMARCNRFTDSTLRLYPFEIEACYAGKSRGGEELSELFFGRVPDSKYEAGERPIGVKSTKLVAGKVYRVEPYYSRIKRRWHFMVKWNRKLILIFYGEEREKGRTYIYQCDSKEQVELLKEMGIIPKVEEDQGKTAKKTEPHARKKGVAVKKPKKKRLPADRPVSPVKYPPAERPKKGGSGDKKPTKKYIYKGPYEEARRWLLDKTGKVPLPKDINIHIGKNSKHFTMFRDKELFLVFEKLKGGDYRIVFGESKDKKNKHVRFYIGEKLVEDFHVVVNGNLYAQKINNIETKLSPVPLMNRRLALLRYLSANLRLPKAERLSRVGLEQILTNGV